MAKAKKTTARNNEAQIALGNTQIIAGAIERVLVQAIKWGAIVACFYVAGAAIEDLAGKVTRADLSAMLSWPSGPHWAIVGLALVFGFGGALYGWRQERLRRDTIERLHWYQKAYEESIDSERSSSRLTTRGETRQEDC